MPARRLTREPRGRTKLWCENIESNPYYVEGSGVPVSDELHVNGSRHYYNLFWRKVSGDDPKLLSIMIEGERKRMAQLLNVVISELIEFIGRKKQNHRYDAHQAKEVTASVAAFKSYNKHLDRYNEYMSQFFEKIEPAIASAGEADQLQQQSDLERTAEKVQHYFESTKAFPEQSEDKDQIIQGLSDMTTMGRTLVLLAQSMGLLRNIE